MKQKLLLLFFLCFQITTFAAPLPPSENCLLIDHLIEVNAEWATKNLTDAFLFEPHYFENDADRIQKHLALVTHFLKQKNNPHLTDNQIVNRKNQLTELTQYWQAKQFPINTGHAQRQPYFVDNFGTACAVGHLVLESGERALVERISNENNFAYLKEMPYSELSAWATKNGFSEEELAWIQPTYPPSSRVFEPLGNDGGIVGQVNVMKANPTDDLLYFAGDFTEIDGIAANDIIAFDGENWQLIPNEIDGEILDMTFNNDGNLLVVGDFEITGAENAALFDVNQQTWFDVGVQAMDGVVKTVEFWEEKLVIGGEFSSINGIEVQNLAYTEYDLFNWRNSVEITENGVNTTVENAFGVDGIVNDLTSKDGQLFIGGEFAMTAPNATEMLDVIGQTAVMNVAEWSEDSWKSVYESNFPVTAMYAEDTTFVTGGVTENFDDDGISFFQPSDTTTYRFDSPIAVDGLIKYMEETFMWGDFFFYPNYPIITMTFSSHLVGFYYEPYEQVWYPNTSVVINAPITAAAEFQEKLYLAGEFTEASGFPVNNLAWTEFELGIFDSTDDLTTQPDNIYTADNQLFINDFPIQKSTQLSLYNLQGQLVETFILEAGQTHFQYDLAHLNDGAFVYYLATEDGVYSGKVVKF